jgi:hypothetical protein
MRVTRDNDRIIVAVNTLEALLLRGILRGLIENYRLKPEQMDPRSAQAWYSPQGCASAQLSAEETSEWLAHLHEYKSARLALLEDCRQQLGVLRKNRRQITVPLEAAPELMKALNDHRLLVAAQQDIGQAEMDARRTEDWDQLKPDQRQALLEIHLLAQFIEELLAVIAPEAAGGMEGLD